AEKRIDSGPRLDPLVEASVRRSLAESYIGMAHYPDARRQLDRAMPLLSKSGDRSELAAALFDRGSVEAAAGNYAAAVQDLDRTLAVLAQLGSKAPPIDAFETKLRLAGVLSPRAW